MRRGRDLVQFHVRFFRRSARFFTVARGAGANDILPGMLSPAVTRYYMVEGQLFSLFAAILAGELVPVIYFGAADFPGDVEGTFNQIREADNRWNRHFPIGSMNITIAVFQHFSPALVKQC